MNDETIVVFDVETADKHHTRLCQIGLVELDAQTLDIKSEFNQFIDPECSFDYYNTKVHGISEVQTDGQPNFKQVWDNLLSNYFKDNQKIVGHNLKFDIAALDKVCANYGIELPTMYVRDTYTMAKHLRPEARSYTLDKVASWFGYDLSDDAHHDALNDARATAFIYKSMDEFANVDGVPFTKHFPIYSVDRKPQLDLFEQSKDPSSEIKHTKGVVKFLLKKRGFGVLTSTDGQDAYVSMSDIDKIDKYRLKSGDAVEYDMRLNSKNNYRAKNVKALEKVREEVDTTLLPRQTQKQNNFSL